MLAGRPPEALAHFLLPSIICQRQYGTRLSAWPLQASSPRPCWHMCTCQEGETTSSSDKRASACNRAAVMQTHTHTYSLFKTLKINLQQIIQMPFPQNSTVLFSFTFIYFIIFNVVAIILILLIVNCKVFFFFLF